jgi:hypothetical protein
MNPRTIVAILLGLLSISSSLAKAPLPAKLFVFHGKVQAIDPGARTFTITSELGTSVFDVTNETRIVRHPHAVRFQQITLDKMKVGEEAEVFVAGGSTRRATAVIVNLEYDPRVASLPSLFAAKTPRGGSISGPDLAQLITYRPKADAFSTSMDYNASKLGVFLLSVRPEGTVSNVEVLSSIGYGELDERTKRWLMKWRFQPNSVVQVKVPFSLGTGSPY